MGIDFKFTGCGSGFHSELGSNSAYFLEKDGGMVLIDCGEGTLAKPSTNNDHLHAEGMKAVITHTHGVHGSTPYRTIYTNKPCIRDTFICHRIQQT